MNIFEEEYWRDLDLLVIKQVQKIAKEQEERDKKFYEIFDQFEKNVLWFQRLKIVHDINTKANKDNVEELWNKFKNIEKLTR